MLVGFQHQGNLGLGYLTSVLRECGYDVHVVDIEQDPEAIVRMARELDPVLIGFSLIFQFYVRNYGALIELLRAAGIRCHFTMGGHFPSLSYRGDARDHSRARQRRPVRGRADAGRTGGRREHGPRLARRFPGLAYLARHRP